jgi:hypothetical protein
VILSRVANDIAAYDQTQYGVQLHASTFQPRTPRASSSSGPAQFHLGESITVDWKAPANNVMAIAGPIEIFGAPTLLLSSLTRKLIPFLATQSSSQPTPMSPKRSTRR